jgi:DUF1680 family protein
MPVLNPSRQSKGLSSGLFLVVIPACGILPDATSAPPPQVVPFRVPARLEDKAEVLSPAAVRLEGFLGARVAVNEKNRLLQVDEEPLLAGFRQKPGSHPWIGEHVGKWLHAATLAWAYTGDPELRAKLDRVAAELVKAQEPDGYLGTYTPDKRFGLYQGADWDVWSHKYNLIGLLTYYQYTGNEDALSACRKMGDLLISTFGPGKKSILSAGTHVGMAATSVLEPVVLLYRFTGEERYLAFARYLVNSWDEPNGPKIIATLLREKQVNKTANGKAYEMLSNLVGLCELARATGDRRLLDPVRNAWEDIAAKRLYLTGSASQGEHFRDDFYLPNQAGANVAESCVTTTWIQLNLQLFRLTGEARFGDELERTIYNHLSAAQRPDGAQWCYFTPLEGIKLYGPGINCCVSSGPRGMALAPQTAYLKVRVDGQEGLAVSTFESSRTTLDLAGQTVTVEQQSDFPLTGSSVVKFTLGKPASFPLQVRSPGWATPLKFQVNGQAVEATLRDGWAALPVRAWKNGDQVRVSFSLGASVVMGTHGNTDRAALIWGPFVLAYEERMNPGRPPAATLGFSDFEKPPFTLKTAAPLTFEAKVRSARRPEPLAATFVPFADAGRDGGSYRVWLRAPGVAFVKNDSLLAVGQESRSRQGNVEGSINDGDAGTFVVTFDGRKLDDDWFAVTLDEPVTIARVGFAPGKFFHDGGWFDASAGKPRIQVQREKGGKWETVGEITSYPATTAIDSAGLKSGPRRAFTARLEKPVKAVAIRVIGKPACGDNPNQAFSSCGELEAFGE